ncbi:MAG: hypothetical protein A2275_18760 [Bacteroidetes bacterium RIFOXYA12_FULL_35_11]|nr:MAG: hypothetical protein A2X01_02195 [Bacteroidetes bacterium GWF2_35_48]OFY82147.1 MAG: hypothetical protein A2275_18760 [Bacteroidetes bacterium RIFOXYA12_FULL_35_11]OFY94703.1 MAG: hypothetical protein A2491_07490 [Bacteroidetes bacterium RIFOXYC12_FULL_35_7]HBX51601.1 hypothetical protein [Bacteroidales bacterium]
MKSKIKPLILIVDDTPQNIQVLANILYEKGYNISIATSGNQALLSVNSDTPDLILLDIQMPEIDGYEVCEKIKSNPLTKDIPIIFLTAKIENEDLLQGFKAGAVDYITKPFNVAELTARVATHLELKRSRARIETLNRKLNVAYNKIKNSIDYARLIQEEMLPDLNILQAKGIQHLLIYKPKDIVSGDFYWMAINNEKLFIAVADCTGHGVPGAMLSISGHNLLNEIINIEKIYDPAAILYKLNERVRNIFKQGLSEVHVGMDIAICVIDNCEKTLEFAGANIPILYFSNSNVQKLIPDKLGIGEDYSRKHKSCFSTQIIKFNKGDRFFIFTDGILDQFDNMDQNKITRKGFEQFFSMQVEKPFSSIKENLMKFMQDWQGDNLQTDDILIVGFEISKPQ